MKAEGTAMENNGNREAGAACRTAERAAAWFILHPSSFILAAI
jgi:hypothetical protein